ncbi:IS3 family transposase (plasmid) [Roseomonas marmotae]|uniref:IS3 family transposase n=1 Tax=Roseomonas marmotae TaxID=2768161 RepID=A0ABS3KLE4_9PROT|nr:IS3 family transposase [Roseomonas marmotae]QTI82010.1 IS3 family transposase [Roseomonas marmotae]
MFRGCGARPPPEAAIAFIDDHREVYGARQVWRQLGCEGVAVARCTVERLMRATGLQGVVRGKGMRTTVSSPATPCPADMVDRQFLASAPDVLRLSDSTYLATWQGVIYVTIARRIVDWRGRPMQALSSTHWSG